MYVLKIQDGDIVAVGNILRFKVVTLGKKKGQTEKVKLVFDQTSVGLHIHKEK